MIKREHSSSSKLDVVSVSKPGFTKYHLTAHPSEGRPSLMFETILDFVREKNAKIITQYVFGGCELHEQYIPEIKRMNGNITWPITWIQGDGASGTSLTGTQACAISGASVQSVRLDGHAVGSCFEDKEARYCLLGDILPTDISRTKEEQAREIFERIEAALRIADMDFSDVARTWLYIDSILSWYDEFNKARSDFFNDRGVFDAVVPASTGIGVSNPAGAALVADVLAIKSKNGHFNISAVSSPLQCSAIDYKSSFSRGVEITVPDYRQLLISGTASIAPGGETIHIGDTKKQIACTMEVVDAILKSRDMGWQNTTRTIAYFKNIEDVPLLEEYRKEKGLPALSFAIAHADICRDDLLFEIEIDAISDR
ncbi:RidA family protein [Verrucomicrobiota bacterium]